MTNVVNNLWEVLAAMAYYFKAAVSLATSNIYFLGFTMILLLFTGKSLKVGRIFSAKG